MSDSKNTDMKKTSLTNKQRLEMLFSCDVPDVPPHFELVFQLGKEMFDMDSQAVFERQYASKNTRQRALEDFHADICGRLIEQFGWAALPALCGEGINEIHAISHLKNTVGNRALVFAFNPEGVFWMPKGEDMMDFIVMLFERPDEMHAKARLKCDTAKELSKRQIDAGVDFIVQNTDFGYNSGPFISPQHFQEFVTPYMTEIVQTIHDLKTPAILHSDGDLRVILDQIYSTGIDGYQSVDPQAHMDIKTVREKYPDWLLMGNVACNLLQDTDEQKIREAVRYCMEHGGLGKRYIFSTSNCIFAGMPSDSYRIMLDEYHHCCRKVLTK
jgi:uroporphyrinogen decarboxylase